MDFRSTFKAKKPLIGMIHLPPLPGYEKHPGMQKVISKALADLKTLEKAGYDGALIENDNDQPHQIGVNKIILNAFAEIMESVIKKAKIPVGMQIIYDMPNTVKIAHQVGAKFVRLDVFVDDVETKWGRIYAQPDIIASMNKKFSDELLLLTDIHVKHAKMLESKSLAASAKEAIEKGSGALIVTGTLTGVPPTKQSCRLVKKTAGAFPVIIGSGLDCKNAAELLGIANGAIVGTSIKTGNFVDYEKASQLAGISHSFG